MKKIVALLAVLFALSVAAIVIIIPSSQLPQPRNVDAANDRFMLLRSNWSPGFTTNYTLAFSDLVGILATNNSFLNQLITNATFQSNFIFYATNSSTINNFITTISPYSLNSGYVLTAAGQVTNYLLDCGRTNNIGQTNIYATIDATANVNLLAITNLGVGNWAPFSFNIIADGGNRVVWFPSSWWNPPFADLSTNNLTVDGSTYRILLTSGNEMRITIQSNAPPPCPTSNHLSVIWTTYGQ